MRKYLCCLLAAVCAPILLQAQIAIKTPEAAEAAYMAGVIEAQSNPEKALALFIAALNVTPDSEELIEATAMTLFNNRDRIDMEKVRPALMFLLKAHPQAVGLFSNLVPFITAPEESLTSELKDAMLNAIFAAGETQTGGRGYVGGLVYQLTTDAMASGDFSAIVAIAERYGELDPKVEQGIGYYIAGRLRYAARHLAGDESAAAVINAREKLATQLRDAIDKDGISLIRLVTLTALVDDAEAVAIVGEAALPEALRERTAIAEIMAALGATELASSILDTITDAEDEVIYIAARLFIANIIDDREAGQRYFDKLDALPPDYGMPVYLNAMLAWLLREKNYDKLLAISGSLSDPLRTELYTHAKNKKHPEQPQLSTLVHLGTQALDPYDDSSFGTLFIEVALREERYDIVDGICAKLESIEPGAGMGGYNNLAYMLARHEYRLDLADKFSQIALELTPTEAAALDTRAWVLHKLGRTEEALPYIEEARAANRDAMAMEDAVIMDHYGDILYALGRKEEAIAAWRRAAAMLRVTYHLELDYDELQKKIAAEAEAL